MNNVYRLLSVLVYPLFIFGALFYTCKKRYALVLKENYKKILLNLIIFSLFGILGIIIYFHFENHAVYTYDYAGYYIKSLELLNMFWENPSQIFTKVYNTINNNDYSYLPALFNFYGLLINNSFSFYCVLNFILFLLPTVFLLLTIYYRYYNNLYIPGFILCSFYPLWLTILYGRIDVLGLFPLLLFYTIIIFDDFENISIADNIILNFLTLLLMFERRWYLYALVGAYLAYMIKGIIYAYKTKTWLKSAFKFISSGILALIILLVFFDGFFENVMTANNAEAYSFWDRSGKLASTINFYSPIVTMIAIFGFIKLFIKDKEKAVLILILLVVPTCLFWTIQSFDFHHYLIICLSIIFLFTYGISCLSSISCVQVIVLSLCFIQMVNIFTYYDIPLFTNIKKHLEDNPYKEELLNIGEYIKEISSDDNIYTYVATGNTYINDDSIRNVLLPDVDFPNMASFVFDIRDGFPRDFGYIRYFVLSDPILYLDEDYQHMYKVISDAITSNEEISKIFELRKEFTLEDNITVYVYEKVGEYTDEMKEYFYNEMLKYYPNKADFYSYILD